KIDAVDLGAKMHSDPRHSNAFAFDGDGPTTLGLHWYIHGRPPSCGAESPEAFGLDVSRCRSTARQPHPARAEAAEPFYPVPLFTLSFKYSSSRNCWPVTVARCCARARSPTIWRAGHSWAVQTPPAIGRGGRVRALS